MSSGSTSADRPSPPCEDRDLHTPLFPFTSETEMTHLSRMAISPIHRLHKLKRNTRLGDPRRSIHFSNFHGEMQAKDAASRFSACLSGCEFHGALRWKTLRNRNTKRTGQRTADSRCARSQARDSHTTCFFFMSWQMSFSADKAPRPSVHQRS